MDTSKDWQSGTSMTEGIKIMFENGLGTDATFIFPGSHEKLTAHRVVLMSRSHVFFVMFSSGLQEPGQDIEITDIEPGDFKDLLKFLYYDDVKLSSENAFHLLYCAQKYEVEVLKARCIRFMYQMLNYDTIGPILDQAVFYDENKLIRTCLDFLSDNATASLKRLKNHHVTKEALQLIVDCDSLGVAEVCVFEACDDWAEEECRIRGLPVTGENKRTVLGPLIHKIRFCSMTTVEMATVVSPRGLLTADEELQTFRFLGNSNQTKAPFPHEKRRPLELNATLPTGICISSDSGLYWFKDFHISLSCSREFTLLGFVFNQKGSFNIRLNHTGLEKFSLCETGMYAYLTKPIPYKNNDALSIEGESKERKQQETVKDIHKITCKTTSSSAEKCRFVIDVKRHSDVLLPFDSLILTL